MEFKCKQCNRIFHSEEALSQHNKSKHFTQEKKSRISKSSIILISLVLIVIAAVFFYIIFAGFPKSYNQKTTDNDNFIGPENATVAIVEFSDFQCPFCAKFYRETEPQIKKDYTDTGKVKFVYKHFPIPSHNNAQKAAEAGECAADIGGQEAFWKMHDKMFDNQNFLSVSNLKRFASEIGLNSSEFDLCLDSGAMAERVSMDKNEGQRLGVSGTPAFFINDEKIEGAQPYSMFKSIIDRKLQ